MLKIELKMMLTRLYKCIAYTFMTSQQNILSYSQNTGVKSSPRCFREKRETPYPRQER